MRRREVAEEPEKRHVQGFKSDMPAQSKRRAEGAGDTPSTEDPMGEQRAETVQLRWI